MTINFRETVSLPEVPRELRIAFETERFPWQIKTKPIAPKTECVRKNNDYKLEQRHFYLGNVFYNNMAKEPLYVDKKYLDTLNIQTLFPEKENEEQGKYIKELILDINDALRNFGDKNYAPISGTVYVDDDGFVFYSRKQIKTIKELNKENISYHYSNKAWKMVGFVFIGDNEYRMDAREVSLISPLALWMGFNLCQLWKEQHNNKNTKNKLRMYGTEEKMNVIHRVTVNAVKLKQLQRSSVRYGNNINIPLRGEGEDRFGGMYD